MMALSFRFPRATLLLLAASLLASGLPLLPAGASGSILFQDNFDSGGLDTSKWTVLSGGYSVVVSSQRLETTVQEQGSNWVNVQGGSVGAPFDASHGVDANVQMARHVSGSGVVAKPDLRLARADNTNVWVDVVANPYYNKVELRDSAGTDQILFAGTLDTAFHAVRIVLTGSGYTGYYDGSSLSVSSTIFSGASSFVVQLQDWTGGSSTGLLDTAAFDSVVVYSYGAATPLGSLTSQVLSKTTGTVANGCPPPPSNAIYDIRDTAAAHWISYHVTSSFPMDIRRWWVEDATGTPWIENITTHTLGPGDYCSEFDQNINGAVFQARPGAWHVETYFKDSSGAWVRQGSNLPFTVYPILLTDASHHSGVYKTTPGDHVSSFNTNEIVNVETDWDTTYAQANGHTLRWHWYRSTDPILSPFRNDPAQTIASGSSLVTIGGSLNIQTSGAAAYPGTWTVRPWLDTDTNYLYYAQYTFTITQAPACGNPTASLTPSSQSGAAQYGATFTPSGSAASGCTVSGWSLSFGDGGSPASGNGAPSGNVAHTYATAGSYTATLTITQSDGKTATSSASVTVTQPTCGAPTASLTPSSQTGGAPFAAAFTRSGGAGSGCTASSWSLSFGDGSSPASGSGAPGGTSSHTYTAAGSYTATLTVTQSDGRSATSSAGVTVTTFPVGLAQKFDGGPSIPSGWSATGFWHVSTKRPFSAPNSLWYGQEATNNYDNGATNSGSATSPAFTVPSGSPVLKFKSWYDTESLTAFDQKLVEITTNGGVTWLPLAQITDASLTWNGESYSLASYAGQTAQIRFRFDTIDSLSNAYQGWFVDDVFVSVPCTAPTVSLSPGSQTGQAPYGASFTLGASASSGCTLASYSFSPGEGSPQTGSGAPPSSATHTYASGGTYTATLTVTESDGTTGSASGTVSVTCNAPTVSLSPPTQGGNAPYTASLTASAAAGPGCALASYLLEYGNGNTQSGGGAPPTGISGYYARAGTFTVNLTVTQTDGKTAKASATITVTAVPPSAVQNLAVVAPTYAQLRVTWSPPSSDGGVSVTAYNVYVYPTPTSSKQLLAQVPASTTSYLDMNLQPGQRGYAVSAVNGAGLEGPSNVVVVAKAYWKYDVELRSWIPQASLIDPVVSSECHVYGCGCGYDTGCVEAADAYAYQWSGRSSTYQTSCYPSGRSVLGPDGIDGFYTGDGHAAYDGDYRVHSVLHMQWDGSALSNVAPEVFGNYGTTHLYRIYWDASGSYQCLLDYDTATSSSSGASTSSTAFSLSYSSKNPVAYNYPTGSVNVPSIDGSLSGSFQGNGDLQLQYTTDEFPSHALRVTVNGVTALTMTPTDASCVNGQSVDGVKTALETSQGTGFFTLGQGQNVGTVPPTRSHAC
ncbi:MAG: hypothetical protein QOE90_3750 [Thermoplasmata archaeon]|jgi:PKD repeat protein|nr:hypothetical protein [Thermoplasmata archaeon]